MKLEQFYKETNILISDFLKNGKKQIMKTF